MGIYYDPLWKQNISRAIDSSKGIILAVIMMFKRVIYGINGVIGGIKIIEKTSKKKELEQKHEQERINRHKFISGSCKRSMGFLRDNFFSDRLIIDSNIWMNDTIEYHNFFSLFRYLLKRLNIRYIFYGPQFEEICNIKKNSRVIVKKKRSRIAIRRIDQLSNENLLSFESINLELKYPGHVDPLLIKLMLISTKNGQSTTLLTDDVELKIRARERLKQHNVDNYRIFEMNDLKDHFENIYLAIKEKIIP